MSMLPMTPKSGLWIAVVVCFVCVTSSVPGVHSYKITAAAQGPVGSVTQYSVLKDGQDTGLKFKTHPLWGKDNSVNRVEGQKKNLLSEQDLISMGLTSSEAKIFFALGATESGGTYGQLNTYDYQIVTWGYNQNSCRYGNLGRALVHLKANYPNKYQQYFGANSFDAKLAHPTNLVFKGAGPGTASCDKLRTDVDGLAALALGGQDREVAAQQVKTWKEMFYLPMMKGASPGGQQKDYLKSEYAAYCYSYVSNWKPALTTGTNSVLNAWLKTQGISSPSQMDTSKCNALCAHIVQLTKGQVHIATSGAQRGLSEEAGSMKVSMAEASGKLGADSSVSSTSTDTNTNADTNTNTDTNTNSGGFLGFVRDAMATTTSPDSTSTISNGVDDAASAIGAAGGGVAADALKTKEISDWKSKRGCTFGEEHGHCYDKTQCGTIGGTAHPYNFGQGNTDGCQNEAVNIQCCTVPGQKSTFVGRLVNTVGRILGGVMGKNDNNQGVMQPQTADTSTETGANGNCALIWPATGHVSRSFYPGHPGIDIANHAGGPVYAVKAGTVGNSVGGCANVPNAGCWGGAGNHIEVKDDEGTLYRYLHCASTPLVASGKRVEQGQKLCDMGTSGHSTGVHLHFSIHPGPGATFASASVDPCGAGKLGCPALHGAHKSSNGVVKQAKTC